MKSRVRIVSDGTPGGTLVYIDGVLQECVRASWSIDGFDRLAEATLTFENVEVDVTADLAESTRRPEFAVKGTDLVTILRHHDRNRGL